MSRRSYKACLEELLTPMGFTHDKQDWSRERGGVLETVNQQVSNIAGTTANLQVCDLAAARLVDEILPGWGMPIMGHTVRIGRAIDGYDHWWRNDPQGPAQLAEAVRAYGLPFLDQMRTYDDQLARAFDPANPGKWHGRELIRLAVLLFRTGELGKARAVLDRPTPKTASSAWVERVDQVRRWLESQPDAN